MTLCPKAGRRVRASREKINAYKDADLCPANDRTELGSNSDAADGKAVPFGLRGSFVKLCVRAGLA